MKVQYTNTMKIQDILKEDKWNQDSTDFKSKKTGVDPITGTHSWDIEYTPLIQLRREVGELYDAYKNTIRKYPEDQKLDELFNIYSKFKRAFNTHVNRKYGK